MAGHHVKESVREIDDHSWLIGNKFLLEHSSDLSKCTWSDGKRGGYWISEATLPLPKTRPLSDSSDLKLVYDAGDASAVFQIGDAFCKVRDLDDAPNTTREHVTYEWLHQRSWSFPIPKVLFHSEHEGRYYIILSRVPGETVDSAWTELDEASRKHVAERVTDICNELALHAPRENKITGVDGNILTEFYMSGRGRRDCSPDILRKSCVDMSMDVSDLVFYHCDLGPGNLMIDPSNGSIGVIDWETAGLVPREWVLTKFRVSRGHDLTKADDESDFRRRVRDVMVGRGFSHVTEQFAKWFGLGE